RRHKVEAVRVTRRGEQLLGLRQVVTVVLGVRAESLGVERVQPPAVERMADAGESRVVASLHWDAGVLEVGRVLDRIDPGLPVIRELEGEAYPLVAQGRRAAAKD